MSVLVIYDKNEMCIEGYRNRTYSLGDKVRVYRNLNNGKWSIQAAEGTMKGKVVGHLSYLKLKHVEFKVSLAGRERILKDKRKNVCAFAIGYLDSVSKPSLQCCVHNEVTFNPYKSHFFCYVSDADIPLEQLDVVYFNEGKAFTDLEDVMEHL